MKLMRKPIVWIVLTAILATGSLFLFEYEPPQGRDTLQNFLDSLPTALVITLIFTAVIYGFYSWIADLIAIEREAKKG